MVVSFVREVTLDFRAGVDERMNIDTDPAAQAMIIGFLEKGAKYGVPIIPTYDTGPDAAILIAEAAAMKRRPRSPDRLQPSRADCTRSSVAASSGSSKPFFRRISPCMFWTL